MAKRSTGAEATLAARRLHINRRMRRLALQSAVGEILRSILGVVLAAAGLLPRVEGAIAQEAIDIWAVLNALRVRLPGVTLTDTVGPMWWKRQRRRRGEHRRAALMADRILVLASNAGRIRAEIPVRTRRLNDRTHPASRKLVERPSRGTTRGPHSAPVTPPSVPPGQTREKLPGIRPPATRPHGELAS